MRPASHEEFQPHEGCAKGHDMGTTWNAMSSLNMAPTILDIELKQA